MHFNVGVLLAVTVAALVHLMFNQPNGITRWLTHMTTIEQACAGVDDSLCTLPKRSRWAQR